MVRILFVCHGNICRSPMAEFIMKNMVEQKGLEDHFTIASAATSTEEIGNPVYLSAQKKLGEHGISAGGKCARQLNKHDYDEYDYIIGMDQYNIKNINRIVGTDPQKKIFRLLDFAGISRDIADPWYTENFDQAYDDIYKGCEALLKHILDLDPKMN